MFSRLKLLIALGLVHCGPPDTTITKLTPEVTVAPGQIDFGEVIPDSTSDETVQIVNAGRTTLSIAAIELADESGVFSASVDPPEDAEAWQLEPGESMPLTVSFAPTDLVSYAAEVVIQSNDDDAPEFAVPVLGTGVIGPQPDINISVDAIDFGTVSSGQTATEYLIVENAGDGPLRMIETRQDGSGAFQLVTNPVGSTIPAFSSATVLVEYTPDGVLSGHTGGITFVSNDPDEPEVSVTMTGGDGGDDTDYPVAVIDGPTDLTPPGRIVLDGSGSTNPGDGPLSFEWLILDAPPQSNAALATPAETTTAFDVDVAGSYTVQLTVTNDLGIASAPAQHTVDARPVEELYIALTWDKGSSDLDLHVVPSGGAFWGDEDLSFCNTETDWGERGSGTHSGDDDDGFGPETISISVSDTAYHIGVHYFEDDGGADVEATVTVYLNGEPHETLSTTLVHNYFWRVGYTAIEDGLGAFVPSDDAPFFSTNRECSE
ncbi:MAG: choice-of-anchor D domain-containing protein [Myxococcota bacterium]|nr:choice-of-anchor D domain-containing protein [Myxococcota bacterium]